MPEAEAGYVLVRSADPRGPGRWLRLRDPREILVAHSPAEVPELLRRVDEAASRGQCAAGFLTYEASSAFDPALVTRAPGPLPLAWFGLYNSAEELAAPSLPGTSREVPTQAPPGLRQSVICNLQSAIDLAWTPSVSPEEYVAAFARVKEYIAAGDTYQVNYTLRLVAALEGDPSALFAHLLGVEQALYGAYVDTGEHVLCSASPELFFTLNGSEIVCRPMKGTAPRGVTTAEDRELAAWLHASEKNRAENVMVVDMVRNDLGRVARTGSVHVPALFEVERYDTLFQMTSTVKAETDAPLAEILAALFPCASITGAPKVRTVQIIAELETAPRGIYCGGIGVVLPGRRAQFSVAIRTLHLDRAAARVEYGAGGGIVWDSVDQQEYEECRTKARVLFEPRPSFRLLETLRWQPGEGYSLLDRHLDRLMDSAAYFGFHADRPGLARRLADAAAALPPQPQRVRLLVDEGGNATVEAQPFDPTPAACPWRVALARRPVDRGDRFLYHKTTHRAVYEAARAEHSECDDVVLWNDRGEVTEATLANVVVELGGERITPPVSCGLLAGTFRARLLAAGAIREGIITLEDLRRAEALFLINSVRGWIPAVLAE